MLLLWKSYRQRLRLRYNCLLINLAAQLLTAPIDWTTRHHPPVPIPALIDGGNLEIDREDCYWPSFQEIPDLSQEI